MRALDADVLDAVWAATEPLLPPPPEHPLGCHRRRVPDRLCLWALLIRLTTGSSWVDIEAILDHQVSDTTLRARRDEWIAAGVFDKLRTEALGLMKDGMNASLEPTLVPVAERPDGVAERRRKAYFDLVAQQASFLARASTIASTGPAVLPQQRPATVPAAALAPEVAFAG